jgi:hypothetical protein
VSSTLDERPAIDRRIAARRQTVREAGARRRLRWLLVLLGLAGGGALVVWLLFQSSFLAVSKITVAGDARSDVAAIAEDLGIFVGMPTVNVPAAAFEERLNADPWVAAADVTVRWPGTVEVTLVEHAPAAWLRAGDGWLLAAPGGAVLETAPDIPEDAPHADVGTAPVDPGTTIDAVEAVAAIEFLNRLPAALVVGASVAGDAESLRAVVAGYVVDLGYPSAMAEKAAALVALLDGEIVPEGSVISVVSPQRPAVLRPVPAGRPLDAPEDVESREGEAGDSRPEAGGDDTDDG